MIQPTFSRILRKLLRSMFGSTPWHPGVCVASDTQTGHVRKNKNKTDRLYFYRVQPAWCSRSACGRGAAKDGLAVLPLEKEAKHLGVLTMV